MFFHTFYKPNCEKKTVTGVQQVKNASQVQYIGCRWQAVFVLTITARALSRSTRGTHFQVVSKQQKHKF